MLKRVVNFIKKQKNIYILKVDKKNIIKTRDISENVKLGKYCIINENVKIEENVEIGDCTYISSGTTVDSNVHIGKYCSIARNVFIAPGVHRYNYVTTHPILFNQYWRKRIKIKDNKIFDKTIDKAEVETYIGNDVWIALNVIIMRGVKIGDGAVIGAGAIVTKDVEPYSIVVGNPAKHIKYRFEKEKIEEIQKIDTKWWDLSPEKLEQRIEHMYSIDDYIKHYANQQ